MLQRKKKKEGKQSKQKLDRKNNPSCSVNYFNTRHKKHFIFSVVGSTEKQYDYRIKGKYC